MKKRFSIILQNGIFPEYRRSVYGGISKSETLDATFMYGKEKPGTALKTVPAEPTMKVKPIKNIFIGSWPLMTIQLGLLSEIKRQKPEAVIAALDPRMIMNLAAFFYCKRHGIPFIWWGHGIRPSGKYAGVYTYLANNSSATILYCEPGKAKLADLGVSKTKLFVAPNTLDIRPIQDRRAPYTAESRPNIISVSRLVKDKKIDLLIKSFALVANVLTDSKLIIVGDGPELFALKDLATKLKVADRVQFVGEAYDEDTLAPLMNSCSLGICSGYVGLNAMHYMGYGLPVIYTTGEPNSPEVVVCKPGITAFTFNAGDANSLASAIVALHQDADVRQRTSGECMKIIDENYSTAKMVKAFEDAVAFACGYKAEAVEAPVAAEPLLRQSV